VAQAAEEHLRKAMDLRAHEHDSEMRRARADMQELVDQLTTRQATDTIKSEQTKKLLEELEAETLAKTGLEAEVLAHHTAMDKYGTDLNTFLTKRQKLADECATLSAGMRVEEMEAQRQKMLSDAATATKEDVETKFNAFRRTEEVEAGRQELETESMRSRVQNLFEELTVHQEESSEQETRVAARLSEVQAQVIAKERSTLDALAMAHRETQRCLDLAESKSAQMVDQHIDLVTESERAACRNIMLEAQLSDQQQKLEEVVSRGSDRLLAVEARAQEFMEDAARKQEALNVLRDRAATDFEANQVARHTLEVQMAEIRGSNSSEVHCLEEQRQTMIDDAGSASAKALELEGKVAELQLKRLELEQSAANLDHSRQELEAELSNYQTTEAVEVQHQKAKIGTLELANQELSAQFGALRQREKHEALQHQEEADRTRSESQEHKATKEEYMDEIAAFRRAEVKGLDKLRQCESNEIQIVQHEFAAELDAFKQVEAKVSARHVAEMRCQKSEVEALHAARREMDANLSTMWKDAEEVDKKMAEQRQNQSTKDEQNRREMREIQGLVQELKEELAAERLVAAELEGSKRAKASELLAARREVDAEIAIASNIKSEAEQDWQQCQSKIRKLEDKLSQLRCATSMALKTAKSNVDEIDEMNMFSERRLR